MISFSEIQSILTDDSRERLESLARQSKQLTEQYFGRTISLYAPIYLSNYCSSHCTYCGFHIKNKINRVRLKPEQMHTEMKHVAATGIENILLLTGESYKATPTSYLIEAADIAKQYFTAVSMEVHPMETDEYKELFTNGVDGITIYQETYDRTRYKEVHLYGKKANYDFRYDAAERVCKSGMRQLSIGILLGLGPLAEDLHSLYQHLRFLEKNYPGVEYSVSFPRLRKIKGRDFAICDVDDKQFIKIICLTRILFPRVGINLSTREDAKLRDNILELGITKISAGSNTSVGGYEMFPPEDQDPQFDISDKRPVDEIVQMLKKRRFDPVFTDWRPINNNRGQSPIFSHLSQKGLE